MQDVTEARFSRCFLPVIEAVPAFFALVILLLYALKPLRTYRPRWMKPFVVEEPPKSEGEASWTKPTSPLRWWTVLLALNLIGFTFQVITALLKQRKPGVWPAITWAISIVLIVTCRYPTAPIPLLLLQLLLSISQCIILVHRSASLADWPSAIVLLASVASMIWILCMPFRPPQLPSDGIGKVGEDASVSYSSPEDNLTPWQFMTVSWMAPLISMGYRRQVNDDDVWTLPYIFKHRLLFDTFQTLRGSVLRRLLVANGIDLAIITFLGLVDMCCSLAVPVLLQRLLFAMEDLDSPRSAAVTYATITLAVRLIAAQSGVFNLWYSRRCYERSRGEMIVMLYDKTLRRQVLSQTGKEVAENETPDNPLPNGNGHANGHATKPENTPSVWAQISRFFSCFSRKQKKPVEEKQTSASMGKLLNIMKNDAYEVAQRFWEFPTIFTYPLGVILSVVLIWRLIGWPCLIGVSTVVVGQVINLFIARLVVRQERKRRQATDVKLQKTSQFIEAIRHLRWYSWEGAWLADIMESRQKELHLRLVSRLLQIMINFVNNIASNFFPVVAFLAYTKIAKQPLRVDIAFPAIDLFNMLESNLSQLPDLITTLLNAYVAMGRIETFMAEPDKETGDEVADPTAELQLTNASFAWPGGIGVLHDVSLTLPTGLTVVYGEVAAGKTALLLALLGELEKKGGDFVKPDETIGYCAQQPWLQSMSIRDNILFSLPYEETRYRQTLEACALMSDMAEFKNGDLSPIGENGVGLSGGQKARVALARAVYSRSRYLLFDDPFAALDHQTAEFIMQRCFAGPLIKDRSCVLVTHRTDIFHDLAKQWIKVDNGRVSITAPERNYGASLQKVTSTSSEKDPAEERKKLEEQQNAAVPDKFIEEEHRAEGGVIASVYWTYVKAGQLPLWGVLLFVVVLHRIVDTVEIYFIKTWGEAYSRPKEALHANDLFTNLPNPEVRIEPWLVAFATIVSGVTVCFISMQLVMLAINYQAGKQLFIQAMEKVSHATFRWYDVTPVGRLMNRVTSDMTTIDGSINRYFYILTRLLAAWVTSVIIVSSIRPTFLAFAITFTAAFVIIFLRYFPTSQSLRRLEMVSLTPLMSNFGALVDGLTTVRAFCAQQRFLSSVIDVVDNFQKMDHFYWSLQSWLQYRFDVLSAFSTLAVTLLALWTNVSPGLTAFVLIAANKYVWATHHLCRFYGQLQMDFVSVERVVELLNLDQEPKGDVEPPAWWPSLSGDIVFEHATLRYAPQLDPALDDISLRIPAGSNVAIIGRTGSGKSTMALSLLATLVPESGRIVIDHEDISKVDREVLRRRVTFLAQEPVLFPGTMRKNLDPLNEYSDEDCDNVLEKIAGRHEWTLDMTIDTGGKGLSQGQRQLVGLARAILRRSAVVILDEATASIDFETAMSIQRILREEMKQSTVITIAHRIEAVKNADYCIVLSKGKLVEAGPAKDMIKKQGEGFGALLA